MGLDVRHVAVTAVGADRPGIVAAVTGVLVDHDANLEDTSMTILRGHFAMMIVAAVPSNVDPGALEAGLASACAPLGLVITVRPIDDAVTAPGDGEDWSLAVYGADRPGIVHEVSSLLAARDVNIVDLATRVIGADDRPVYAMFLELTLAPSCDRDGLAAELADLGRRLGVECTLQPSDADIL
jgi:glycine cleavage system transcriptional repressor